MEEPKLAIPPFRADGYLPEGVHLASEAEVTFRFGASTKRRRKLAQRLRRWIDLSRQVGVRRFLVDGSYVTAKPNPNDVDAIILLPENFEDQVDDGQVASQERDEMLLTHRPEEIFAAEDDADWREWIEFFSRTRENDRRCKGVVDVQL